VKKYWNPPSGTAHSVSIPFEFLLPSYARPPETAADGVNADEKIRHSHLLSATIPNMEMFSFLQTLTLAYALAPDFCSRLFG
jgi:hypothetical protein